MAQMNSPSMQSVLSLNQTLQGVEANIISLSAGPVTPQTTEKINELNSIKQNLITKIQVAKQSTLAENQQKKTELSSPQSTLTHQTNQVPMVNITTSYNTGNNIQGATVIQQQRLPQTSQVIPNIPQEERKIISKQRLQDLVREIDPNEQLDEDVEELLMLVTDDFIESTVNSACILAKHRNSNTLEIKDLKLHLEKEWNISVPGFGSDEVRSYKKPLSTEAHKQRLALIRKATKK